MNHTKIFGAVLSGIRKEQGYPSAHQFFNSIGGSKALGLSFVSYWDLERGKKLPKSWRLKAIISALGIEQHSSKAQELVRAYFRALSRSDELLNILSAPAAAAADLPSRELAEAATHQAIAKRNFNFTIAQWKLLAGSQVANICHNFLLNTAGWVTVRELSAATKFKPEAVRKAFQALAGGGLIAFSGEKARSPYVDKVIKSMPVTPETAAIRAALLGHWKKWLAESKLVSGKTMTVRMTKANLELYRQHLQKAMELAAVYDGSEASREETAVYFVSVDIFRSFPKD